jgi:hypothetical protein
MIAQQLQRTRLGSDAGGLKPGAVGSARLDRSVSNGSNGGVRGVESIEEGGEVGAAEEVFAME